MFKFIIFIAISVLIPYTIMAFVTWDLHPYAGIADWESDKRVSFLIGHTCSIFLGSMVADLVGDLR